MESPSSLAEAYRLLRELDLRRAGLIEYIALTEKKEEAEENARCIMHILYDRGLLSEEVSARFLPLFCADDLLLHHEISFSTHARVESCTTPWMKRNGIVKCTTHYCDDFQLTNIEEVRSSLPSVPSYEELEQAGNIELFLAYVHYHALPFFHSVLRD